MEQKREVKVFEVNYKCDHCEEGLMRFTGTRYLTSPPKYSHQCTKCKANQTFSKCYPTQEYN